MQDENEDLSLLDEQDVATENADASEEAKPEYSDAEKKAYARAKDAETKLKEAKTKLKELEAKQTLTAPSINPDELKLIARGLSDEEIDQAKAIAKGKDIPLNEALKDPMFIAYQKDQKEAERKEKAKLGASKGSGQDEDSSGFRPGMTEAEHKAEWEKTRAK